MNAFEALFWGAFSSASLFIGAWLAGPMAKAHRLTGLIMGFGAGTLLSAVAYELIPQSSIGKGPGIAISFGLGAVVYFVGDHIVDRTGGAARVDIDPAETQGSGMAMFLGALLDGIPEAFILGITIGLGGSISVAFLTAVFVSNIPQGLAGTVALKAAGYTNQSVWFMWTALTIAAALASLAGYLTGDNVSHQGLYAEAFAAGAVLTMLADSMMPEAFDHGGRLVGLVTVLGYLVAATLTVLD
jgi:zinc transporter, ZIP family